MPNAAVYALRGIQPLQVADPIDKLIDDHYHQRLLCDLLAETIVANPCVREGARARDALNDHHTMMTEHHRDQRRLVTLVTSLYGSTDALTAAIATHRTHQNDENLYFHALCGELRRLVTEGGTVQARKAAAAAHRYVEAKRRFLAWENANLIPLLRRHRDRGSRSVIVSRGKVGHVRPFAQPTWRQGAQKNTHPSDRKSMRLEAEVNAVPVSPDGL
jgi:hypothetical protein